MITPTSSTAWRDRTSLRQATIRTTSHSLVLAELRRRGDSLLPGAAEALADRWAPRFDNARAEVIAEHVSRLLTDANVVRQSVDPGRQPDTAGKSALRVVLDRHAPDLRQGAIDALIDAWSFETRSLDPHQLAGFVSRRLTGAGSRSYLNGDENGAV